MPKMTYMVSVVIDPCNRDESGLQTL